MNRVVFDWEPVITTYKDPDLPPQTPRTMRLELPNGEFIDAVPTITRDKWNVWNISRLEGFCVAIVPGRKALPYPEVSRKEAERRMVELAIARLEELGWRRRKDLE